MRVADFIIDRLNKVYGIKYISLLTGNGSLVINDAICMNKKITPICVHHEQDAGYFCLGYSKYTNKLSVCNPTTGCAGTNCITPLLAAFQDHVPILFISGNVALNQTTRHIRQKTGVRIKKLGVQELDIIEIVTPLTKYAVMVDNVQNIKYELDKAIQIATTAPYGPVWVDLPSSVGAAMVNESDLREWSLSSEQLLLNGDTPDYKLYTLPQLVTELKNDIFTSQRPLVLFGNGIVLSNTQNQLKCFVEKYQIPAVSTYGGIDVLGCNNDKYIGVVGVKGNRSGNFSLQSCDVLISLGCCLNTSQIGYESAKFAPNTKKWVVDLDTNSFKRNDLKIDKFIKCDLVDFFQRL